MNCSVLQQLIVTQLIHLNSTGKLFLDICITVKLTTNSDNSEPCFQFYSGGLLAGIIRGCNAPLLENMIREKTGLEEQILRGEAERVPFTDSILEDSNAGK